MSIDAIGRVVAGVSALAASRTGLATGNRGANSGQSSATDQTASAAADATVVAISEEAQAQQQAAADQAAAAADQAARDAAVAANASAVTDAVSSDWATGAPTVDSAAVQEALDALDEVSRENNVQVEHAAIQGQEDQNALDRKTIEAGATAAVQREDDIVLTAINAGIRVAFGSLATPITGDPALREPGKVDIVA